MVGMGGHGNVRSAQIFGRSIIRLFYGIVMKKAKVLLQLNDWVKLRGRVPWGRISNVNPNKWVVVDWYPEARGPTYVHLDELEKIDEP